MKIAGLTYNLKLEGEISEVIGLLKKYSSLAEKYTKDGVACKVSVASGQFITINLIGKDKPKLEWLAEKYRAEIGKPSNYSFYDSSPATTIRYTKKKPTCLNRNYLAF